MFLQKTQLSGFLFAGLAALALAISQCKKSGSGKAPVDAAGVYCDRARVVEIRLKEDSLAYIRKDIGPTVLTWKPDINAYYVHLPRQSYKLEYKNPGFALHQCSSETDCHFQRLIKKCD